MQSQGYRKALVGGTDWASGRVVQLFDVGEYKVCNLADHSNSEAAALKRRARWLLTVQCFICLQDWEPWVPLHAAQYLHCLQVFLNNMSVTGFSHVTVL